jgi:hypothetical protein
MKYSIQNLILQMCDIKMLYITELHFNGLHLNTENTGVFLPKAELRLHVCMYYCFYPFIYLSEVQVVVIYIK